MTDFISALVAGFTQVGVGHPFDTVKVLLQNGKSIKKLKIRDYYRGSKYPLVSSLIFNSVVFPVYERSEKYTKSIFLSGMLSGFVVAPIIFSFDVGKIKNQTLNKLTYYDYFFTKGRLANYGREMIGIGMYFTSYSYFKKKDLHPLISGGLAGLCNWTASYPLDVIKSRQIANDIGIKEAINMGNLWKGYHICALRALIVNACIFYSYETTKKFLDNDLKII